MTTACVLRHNPISPKARGRQKRPLTAASIRKLATDAQASVSGHLFQIIVLASALDFFVFWICANVNAPTGHSSFSNDHFVLERGPG